MSILLESNKFQTITVNLNNFEISKDMFQPLLFKIEAILLEKWNEFSHSEVSLAKFT